MVGDVVVQLEELTALVADLVELARDGERHDEIEDVRLDVLVADSVERVRRRAPAREFDLELEPTLVRGSPARLDRAVVNLLENAVAWGPPASRSRSRSPTAPSRFATTGRGSRKRMPRAVRPLLPLARGARAARLGARARDRAPGRRGARRAGRRRAGRAAAARGSGSRLAAPAQLSATS